MSNAPRGSVWLLCGSLALTLGACGNEAKEAKQQWPISRAELEGQPKGTNSADGAAEATYNRYCLGCHGTDGRGNGGLTGADFTAANTPLALRSESELVASVRDGKRGSRASMPAHGPVLSEAQITAVVAYVRQRFLPTSGTTDAATLP